MLLETLTRPFGVSGAENSACSTAKSILEKNIDDVSITKRGTVLGIMNGQGPRILLDAHLDQVGFIVTSLCDNGFVKFDKCGGTDERILSGLEVTILGKESVYGVISSVPPHLADPKEEGTVKLAKDMAIDTGLTKSELESLVSLGDRIVPKYEFRKLLRHEVCSGALDDRSGMAVIIEALELINKAVKNGAAKPNLAVSFSVQEEVSGHGAGNAAFEYEPDMAIAVDVSFAYTPGCKQDETGEIGKGPMIGIAPVLDNGISNAFKRIAKEINLPHQFEIMTRRTGTHADEISISKTGVKTGLISIPLKYMHTPVEIVNTEDVENCARLIAQFCLNAAGGKI